MSTPQIPTPARLVISVIYVEYDFDQGGEFVEKIIAELEGMFGGNNFVSEKTLFTQTTYYNNEMGDGLNRFFVSFEKLTSREMLADIKLSTNTLEKKFARQDHTRRCNIDPAFLTVENFILATGKNFTHRIYLKDGIFSEVTLLFQKGKFQTLPWTYWDYASESVLEMLTQMRKVLIQDLKDKKLLKMAD